MSKEAISRQFTVNLGRRDIDKSVPGSRAKHVQIASEMGLPSASRADKDDRTSGARVELAARTGCD